MAQPSFKDRARGIKRGVLMRPVRLAIIVSLVVLGVAADNMFNSSPYLMLVMTVVVGSVLVTRWMFEELGFKKK